jgi:hypothetical protein
MRDRGQRTPLRSTEIPEQSECAPALPITRVFSPDDIDLDALACAIQELLADAGGPAGGTSAKTTSHLLSGRNRASHVVEANGVR